MTPRIEQIGAATLILANCYEIVSRFAAAHALVTDQPYGISYSVSARGWQNDGLNAMRPWKMAKRAPIHGDDKPFNLAPFLAFPKIALFGANHCAHALPAGGRWIVWDKRRDSKPDNHSDCEFVWTNVSGADRIHRQKWRGIVREGEENCRRSRKRHPNQKPVALMTFVIEQLNLEARSLIVDPFMGSGSTGVAALRMGHRFVGIEIEPTHFETALLRLRGEFSALNDTENAQR